MSSQHSGSSKTVRQRAERADRMRRRVEILKGAKAGNLPIEGPDRFELIINRRTASAMGLTIPRALLVRAEEVIQ